MIIYNTTPAYPEPGHKIFDTTLGLESCSERTMILRTELLQKRMRYKQGSRFRLRLKLCPAPTAPRPFQEIHRQTKNSIVLH